MHQLIARDAELVAAETEIARASKAYQEYVSLQQKQRREHVEAMAAWTADTEDALLTGRIPRPAPTAPVEQPEFAHSLAARPIELTAKRREILTRRAAEFTELLAGREVALMRQAAEQVAVLRRLTRELAEITSSALEIGATAYPRDVGVVEVVRAVQSRRGFVRPPVLDAAEELAGGHFAMFRQG